MSRWNTFILLVAITAIAFAQPVPVEFLSHKSPDSIRVIKGPDGKLLADGSLVYAIRMRDGKPGMPRPGTGLAENESIIQKTQINPDRVVPGEISFVMTVCDNDEFWKPHQGIKGEKIFLRVFATTDTLLPKGTAYAETPLYTLPELPHSIDGVTIGQWKKIP